MSDAILNDGPNHYYYIGNDKFLFGGDSRVSPLEDTLSEDGDSWEDAGDSLKNLARLVSAFREHRIEGIVSQSATLNRACRALLGGIEARLASQEQTAFHREPEHAEDGASSFPHGSKVTREIWSQLLLLAEEVLRTHGYLITQRDKKYLTEKSGVFVTPYIWSTLVGRMGLRKVKNPYSSSALVIYVPSHNG